MPKAACDIGLVGLAVMGQNLVLNMNDHGYKVAVFNRTTSKVDKFMQNQAKDTAVTGAHSIEEMCGLLKKPRRVMLMVKAGEVVDETIRLIVPHLVRLSIGSDNRLVVPFSAVAGAIFVVFADTVARTAIAPRELPVRTVTALIGAPLFIYLLRKN